MKRSFQIIYTSDVHGKVFPVDYSTGKEKNCGLLNLAGETEKGRNTLVLDGGDSLQGTPMMSYYLEHAKDFSFHPMAEAFGALGLDYFTLGNHDFNFGYDVLRDYVLAMQEKGAVCLCANVEDLRGEIPIEPYRIHTLENGLRIGITGVVTDHVNIWEDPAHLTELRVTDPVAAAEALTDRLRAESDVTICIYHGGYEEDLKSGKLLSDSMENRACVMAKCCDFDLLLTGHQHMETPGRSLYGSFTMQPPANLERYCFLSGTLEEGETAVLTLEGEIRGVGQRHAEQPYQKMAVLEEKTERWLDETVGVLSEAVEPEDKLWIGLHGSRVAALFNTIELEETGADFACTGLGNTNIALPKALSIRSIYAAYPFANTTVVKKVSGRVLREALERCAQYLELDAEGKPYISDAFMKPKVEHYNYDFYAGLDYAFDLRKPVGERVVRLQKLDGTEIREDGEYRLALSNYRATGTGGYPMLGEAEECYNGADNVQDLLVDYVRRHKLLTIEENYKFKVYY